MAISNILYFYVVCYVIFADAYVVFPWLRPITILNYILVAILLVKPSCCRIKGAARSIQHALFIFILYLFLVDISYNDTEEALSRFITALPIPYIFAVFVSNKNIDKIVTVYSIIYILYNGTFAIAQYFGVYITAGEMFSKVPFLGVSREVTEDFMRQGLRITGATSSTIGLACNIGIIFIFLWYRYGRRPLKKSLMVSTVAMAFMSQTRSLLYSIPISIGFVELLYSKFTLRGIMRWVGGAIIVVALIYTLYPYIEERYPRLFLGIEQDYSIVHRIQANVYGVVGTFELSPWLGLPKDRALEAIERGYRELGLIIGDYFIDEVTYHNQIAYYFRHYGFIGVGLFFFVLIRIISYIRSIPDAKITKKYLYSVIVFYALYTMFHNNKILSDYYLWMFLAIQGAVKVNGGKKCLAGN